MSPPEPTVEDCFAHLTLWRDAIVTQQDRTMVSYPRWPGSPDYKPQSFITRRTLADAFFFVLALRNFQRAAEWIVPRIGSRADQAFEEFRSSIPDATALRNMVEHFDAYMESQGRMQEKQRKEGKDQWGTAGLNAWLQSLPNFAGCVLKVSDGFQVYKVDLPMATRAVDTLYSSLSRIVYGRVKWLNEP